MVGVAQLVERQTVDLDVAGSNPVTHPIFIIGLRRLITQNQHPIIGSRAIVARCAESVSGAVGVT